jgi:hypothetical protein
MPVTSSNPSMRALPASEVFARFLKLAGEELYKPDCSINLQTGLTGLHWTNIRFVQGVAQGPEPTEIAKMFAERPAIGITLCQIQRTHQNQNQIMYECPDGLIAKFSLNSISDAKISLQAFDLVEKYFDVSPVSQIVVNNDNPWNEAVLKAREATISDFYAAQQKLIAAAAEFTAKDAESRRIAEAEADKRYHEREAQLVKEHNAKLAELDNRASELKKKEGLSSTGQRYTGA